MKNNYVIILLIGFVCLIAFGVYGLTCSRKNSSQKETGNGAVTGIRATPKPRFDAANLLKVKMPATIPSQEKQYEGFTVSFNKENHTPNWVAWELLATETDGSVPRYNTFWNDPDIEGCAYHSDYRASGYDRGHICPAADQKWSQQAMMDCFSLANICPQANALNTGAWRTLETKERYWAQRDSALLIVSGPIYSASDKERIGATGVRVPGAFFKIFAAPGLDSPRGIAFVYPNMAAPGNMQNYVVTIDEVEKLTGYDFFAALPDDIEEKIESQASFKEWNRR